MTCNACFSIFSKFIIGAANIIAIIITIIIIVVYYRNSGKSIINDIENNITFKYCFLTVGIIFFLIYLFGIFTAFCRNKCIYLIYLIASCIILFLIIIMLILVNTLLDAVINDIKNIWNDNKYEIIKNKIENKLGCCGFNEVNDTNCGYNYSHNEVQSCESKINDEVSEYQKNITIDLIFLLVIQLIIVFLALYLVCCYIY